MQVKWQYKPDLFVVAAHPRLGDDFEDEDEEGGDVGEDDEDEEGSVVGEGQGEDGEDGREGKDDDQYEQAAPDPSDVAFLLN